MGRSNGMNDGNSSDISCHLLFQEARYIHTYVYTQLYTHTRILDQESNVRLVVNID